jgi:hypothetical protein
MLIRVKIQRHLAVGHLAEDNGDWVFTLCRRGLQDMVGERLHTGSEYLVDITGDVMADDSDEQWLKTWLREEPQTD